MHVHNERNFPQAKLDSEMNVRFLLNEHGDLYFLLHNNSVHIVFLNFIGRKKRYRQKSVRNHYSVMQIMNAKIMTLRTLYVHVVSNSVMFPEILHDIVLYARHVLPVKLFSEYVSSYRKM